MAVVVLAGGLLVGCGSEPNAESTPTTVTPEPEPEPTDEAPEEPEAPLPRAGAPDEYDAEDAGKFFLELYEYTLTTRDSRQWEERSHPDCGFCANVLSGVEMNRSDQAQLIGVDVAVGEARFVAYDEVLRMFAIEVPYVQAPTKLVGPDGEILRENSGGAGYLLLDLGYQPSGGWQLRTGGHRDQPIS